MRFALALLLCTLARAEVVAPVPFLWVGVSDADAARLAADLAEAAARRSAGRAIPVEAVMARLLPDGLPDGCPEDAACLRGVARKLGADELLVLVATSAGARGNVRASVARADAAGRVVARAETEVVAGDRARAIARLIAGLYGADAPAAAPGLHMSLPASGDPAPASATAPRARWWIWAAGAAAVAGGIALALALRDDAHGAAASAGTLGEFGPGAPP